MEDKLYAHIMKKRRSGAIISRQFIKVKALLIAQKLRLDNFQGSNGWMANFLKRRQLCLRRITSVGRALPNNSTQIATNHLHKMKKLFEQYSRSQILNMDETNIQLDSPSISLNTIF